MSRAWQDVRDRVPASLAPPAGWRLIEACADGRMWALPNRQATVIESVAVEQDGRRWHHVSVARRDRTPTWDELAAVKAAFIGAHRYAYVVVAPRRAHVNLHEHCLHLWSCLDAGDEGAVLPDFTRGGTSL